MKKNVASQIVIVFAWDTANGVPKTGDAGNITAQISKDGGGAAGTNTANPTEIDAANLKGLYYFPLTQGETDCDVFALSPVSGTADIDLEPVIIHTTDVENEVWDEVLTGATHNVPTSAGRRLRTVGTDAALIREDTCQAGSTASTIILDAGASGTNNFYDHMVVYITDGTGAGQVRTIHNYVGGTQTADVGEDWLTTPDDTSEFTIIAIGSVHVHELTDTALAQVNAEVDQANADYDAATGTEMSDAVTALTGEIDGNETKIDAVKSDSAAILVDTDTMEADLKTYMDTKETNLTTEIDANETKIDLLQTDLTRILGLLFQNAVWEYTYDANDNQTGGIIWLYDTLVNANSHDGVTGLIGKYTATILVNANGDPTEMTIVKNS